jgi:hypothetical protein
VECRDWRIDLARFESAMLSSGGYDIVTDCTTMLNSAEAL